ncbi:hypothetical protein [Mycobacterium sp. 1465703.0]|uniref:hypothetical protein n=1 Tax=Mycobacterium sp. 1465703.0 TaxID=1834078 RepID=UPI0007FBAD98|nr:hypothetical protein [Mycobacterium sp. 1465703.0]OBI95565.1 hypothetical protein A5625_08095 [Mycobacterium sp. 1465703.0]
MSAHECLAAGACRNATVLTNDEGVEIRRDGAATEHENTLCPACRDYISKAVRQLPKDWAQLRATLGERARRNGQKVRSTPEPAVPISARKDALMRDIVETARRAAELVADAINARPPAGRRLPAPPAQLEKPVDARSVAVRSFDDTRVHDGDLLAACIRMVEPNLDALAGNELSNHYVWNRDNERHEIVQLIGVDVAFDLVDLHNQARAELGLTRLRHRYEMPCPNCGAAVGRDDGTTIVDCKNCNSAWTEREYQFLAGLITHERLDMELLKWLLAEAYWRLDMLQNLDDMMHRHKNLDADAAAALEILDAALGEHKRPADRVVATDRKTAAERQAADDTWAFGNEPTYQRPKRKPAPAREPITNPIPAGSLSTLVDIDENVVINGDARCRDCNLIHAGTCP